MATAKEKGSTLQSWGSIFPALTPWLDKFLIQRTGPLISGICLDATRDPNAYKPTFFHHNLLAPWPVLTLSYAAALLYRGTPKSVKYGAPVADLADQLKAQVESARIPITFAIFLRHIGDARRGVFGPVGLYLPHALRDIITVGSYLGDADHFRSRLDEVCARIASVPNLNVQIIGSVAEWRKDVEAALSLPGEELIEKHQMALRLPALPAQAMPYERPQNFLELLS
jgi:hypothetical protein